LAKTVDEWVQHWDAKVGIKDPVELNGYCVEGVPLTFAKYRQILIEPSIARLEVEPGQKVLEIGCGSGQILHELESRGAECIGADPSRHMLQRCSGKSKTYLKAAHELEFDCNSFDRILMVSVVHYFPSMPYLADVIGRCLDWLRASGIILIGDIPIAPAVNARSDYLTYDRYELLRLLDRLGHPYSMMAQIREKRLVNRRIDVAIYKDRA
jgi:ubiquinone/menaquinone biosynthesis C-methylase UbiE